MYKKDVHELEKEYADYLEEQRKEIQNFPLAAYSTTQLKQELRRRKRERMK